MQSCAPPRDAGVDRQDLSLERRKCVSLQPIAQSSAMLEIATFHQENAALQLEHSDDREVHFRLGRRLRPRPDIGVNTAPVAKLGPDVRVDQIRQSKSAGGEI
jgi:hypothetical protein